MLSPESVVQNAATIIVGILFLISLRQALGLHMTGTFFMWLTSSIIIPFSVAAVLAILGFIWLANILTILGFILLVVVLLLTATEARRLELKVH